MREQLTEEGIVVKAEDGKAEIAIIKVDNCEECHAKMVCKPANKKDDLTTVMATDSLGVHPGDSVKFAVDGFTVLKASAWIYGVPLVLLIIGMLIGDRLFVETAIPELFTFLFSLGLLSIYYLGYYIFFRDRSATGDSMPRVTHITKRFS